MELYSSMVSFAFYLFIFSRNLISGLFCIIVDQVMELYYTLKSASAAQATSRNINLVFFTGVPGQCL